MEIESVTPRVQARNKLLEFYHKQVEALERKPSDKEFFPVALEKLAEVLLPDWKILKNRDLFQVDVSTPILGKADFERKTIYLNPGTDPRTRYTLAHELGHVFLNHGGCCLRKDLGQRSMLRPEQLEPADKLEQKREKEANAFAAELLMPERTVLREFKRRFGVNRLWVKSPQAQLILKTIYNKPSDAAARLAESHYGENATTLAEFFGVSSSAMRIRLLELSLVH